MKIKSKSSRTSGEVDSRKNEVGDLRLRLDFSPYLVPTSIEILKIRKTKTLPTVLYKIPKLP